MSVFPRLAGQHADYLTRQMQMLRVALRDESALSIHGAALKGFDDASVAAVASYLESK